ncbi:MAG: ABC transporter permease [Firmicutes bacterium]|nr:ABC transporter permease [Bacillota bacterium]
MRSGRLRALEGISPVLAVCFGVIAGSVLIAAMGKNPVAVYGTMFRFCLGRADSIGAILFKTTPLVFSGLAVAVGQKAGILNIGIEGQYFIGSFLAALAGFGLKGLPGLIHLPLAIAAGMTGGLMWAAVPAYLKIRRGVHEVISTIMMNYIAFSLVHYMVADVFMDKAQMPIPGLGSPRVRTPLMPDSAMMPKLHGFLEMIGISLPKHTYVNWFLPLGLALVALMYFIIWRTSFGYEVRAVGQNARASEAAGIKPGAVTVRVFLLSGAIAGLVGLSDLLCYFGYLDIDFPKGYGFNGVAVALLGRGSPVGIVLASLLFAFLDRGAEGVQTFAGIPMETMVILQGVMILSILVFAEISSRYVRQVQRREAVRG